MSAALDPDSEVEPELGFVLDDGLSEEALGRDLGEVVRVWESDEFSAVTAAFAAELVVSRTCTGSADLASVFESVAWLLMVLSRGAIRAPRWSP